MASSGYVRQSRESGEVASNLPQISSQRKVRRGESEGRVEGQASGMKQKVRLRPKVGMSETWNSQGPCMRTGNQSDPSIPSSAWA